MPPHCGALSSVIVKQAESLLYLARGRRLVDSRAAPAKDTHTSSHRIIRIKREAGMTDVFISYSRRDRPFVEQLRAALEAAKRSVWVDLRDIPPSADWRDEIHQAINGSDTIICVLSPDYVSSPICREEVEYAAASNKRLVPIVYRDVSGQDAPPSLAALNWIFYRQSDDQDISLRQLLSALETDLAYVRSGTRLLVRAKEWESKDRNASFTLRGKDLAEAEQWLATSGGKKPAPSQEQTQYIVASRRASSRRQRTTIGALTVGIIITLTLSIISTALYRVTSDQNRTLRAHDIAGKANDALTNSHLDQGLLLAVAASKQYDDFDTRNALLNGLDSAAYLDSVLIGAEPSGNTSNNNYADTMYSADGRTLMTADLGNSSVIMWDGVTHKLLRRLNVPELSRQDPASGLNMADFLEDAAISADGSYIATKSYLSGIRVWNADTGALEGSLPNSSALDNSGDTSITRGTIRFSPDGKLLAWSECVSTLENPCGSEHIIVADISSGNVLPVLPIAAQSPAGLSVTLAFSPDSSMLAVGVVSDTQFLNNQLGGIVYLFHVDSRHDTDALLASVSLGSAGSGSTSQPSGDVTAVAFSPDGSLLAIAGDQDGIGSQGQVLCWNVAQRRFTGASLRESDGSISAEAFSPDGRFLVTGMSSGDFGLRVWNVEQRYAVTPVLRAHTQTVDSVAFSPDGKHFVSSGADGQVLVWRLAPYSPLSLTLGADYTGDGQVAFSPNGALMAVGGRNEVTLWNVKSGSKAQTLLIPASDRDNADDDIGGIAFSPDGKMLAAGDQLAQVIVWNLASGAPVGPPLKGHRQLLPTMPNFVWDVVFSPDSALLVSSGEDGQAIVWNVNTWSIVHTFTADSSLLERQAAFSPDGRYLAVGGGNQNITIWDVARGSVARTLNTGGVSARALAFYPHETATLAALDSNGMITTWDARTGATIGQQLSDGKLATSLDAPHLAFNPAGTLLISSHDLTLTMWTLTGVGHGQKYVRAIVPEYSQMNAALSPDGRYVAIATVGGVEVHYATLAGWRASACASANRTLTQSEWRQFIPNTPYQAVC